MTTTIQKWGNSQGIRIPKHILDTVHWDTNEKLMVTTGKDCIIIKKVNQRKNIKQLFSGFKGEYVPEEMDWGKPMGNEIW